jgi:hypothetical protein
MNKVTGIRILKSIASTGFLALVLIGAQGCSQTEFESSKQAALEAPSVDQFSTAPDTDANSNLHTPGTVVVSPAPQPQPQPVAQPQPQPQVSAPTCAGNRGQACQKIVTADVAGCEANYGCAAFEGVYYDSPNGCDPATASSWVEYRNNFGSEEGRGQNSAHTINNPLGWERAGEAYHCTYVGFAAYDPFHNVANGSCVNATAAGYPIPNTYTKVIPGTGCTHRQQVAAPGTIQCDGSCQ